MNYNISTFVDELVEAKDFGDVSQEVLEQIKKDLTARVENRIHALIATHIPDGAKEEFEKLIDSDASDEEVSHFCSDKIPDLQNLIVKEMSQFRSIYVGS